MALTARQRNRLPASAFLDRRFRRFPVPTAAQARAAGISQAQRLRTLRNALSRAGQAQPRRQARGRAGRMVTVKTVTPSVARPAVRARASGKIESLSTRRRASGGARRRASTSRRRAPSRSARRRGATRRH